jgi:pimeloyl-ACP methyl ester carboxylesterase
MVGLWLALLVNVSACTGDRSTRTGERKVALKRCHLSSPGGPSRVEAECGYVQVPEDWSKPAGRKIRLHVAVIPATGDRPKPDPLFFFAGGPGQAATESYAAVAHAFSKIARSRDVVLVDQRGTGRSNPLRCEPPSGADPYREFTAEEEERWLRSCISSLKADLAQYTTMASVRDFNRVRVVLGYKQINLYGISYGTRVALSYLRQHQGHVRSVVLDGVVPQDTVLGPAIMAEGPKRTKDNTIRRCNADPSCKKRFPNLSREFSEVERTIRTAPPLVEATHPRTGKPVKARLNWQGWSLTLRMFGYASETVALLPLLIHTAYKSKDFGPLLAQAVYVADMLLGAISSGLENSVLCGEDWPFFSRGGEAAAAPYYGAREIKSLARICKIWPHKRAPAGFKAPVVSSVPTLILSGEIDPVTPPSNGEVVSKTLSRSLHVVVPGHGHGVVGRGCVPKEVAEFVKTARVKDFDTSCVGKIRPIRFFIDFAGPVP